MRKTANLCSHFAVVYPAQRGKVRRLGTVKAMIEASVIPIRKCDHELPRFLSNLKKEGGKKGEKIYTNVLQDFFSER